MKRLGLTPHLVSATLFLVWLPALGAQESMTAPNTPTAKAAKRSADLLKRFDTNRDGKLDDDERATAKEEMMKEQMNAQMNRAAAMPGGAEAFRARMLELFDQDKDGRLDGEERTAAQKFAQERGFGPNGELRDDLIKRFDRNGNGRIDDDEKTALQEFVKERMAQAPAVAVANRGELEKLIRNAVQANAAQRQHFDRDGDGKLSDSEWATARQEIQRALAGGGPGALGPAAEKKRLDAVAAEVARRRKLRDEAAKKTENAKQN